MSKPKFKALDVRIEKDAIVIRAHAQCVAFATENHPTFWNPETGENTLKVVDEKQWLKGVLAQLEAEEEDGSTPVHHMLDAPTTYAPQCGSDPRGSKEHAERHHTVHGLLGCFV